MKKILPALLLAALPLTLFANYRPVHPDNPNLPPYGKIDKKYLPPASAG